MMEPEGTVQHCIAIANSSHNVHVGGLITDDYTTTRANCKHSCADITEKNRPGSKDENGDTPSRKK